jgi:hypothetical protein
VRIRDIPLFIKVGRVHELNKSHIISTDEDPGLRIESLAVINLRGVFTNKKYYSVEIVSCACFGCS